MKLTIDSNNNWNYEEIPSKMDHISRKYIIIYINSIYKLFQKAKEVCEFEFIFTLLRIRGMSGAGWDPFETSDDIFNSISELIDEKREKRVSRYLGLWLYGHIVESSEIYEILANLLNICKGERYHLCNFPHKRRKKYLSPQTPSEKIDKLECIAKSLNLENSIHPIRDIFDRELRNAVFHSDYSLFDGELRMLNPIKIYSNDEFVDILNKSFAFYLSFSSLLRFYIESYDEPKLIEEHPGFSINRKEMAKTIIRKGYGLVGLRCNVNRLKNGIEIIQPLIGKFSNEELKMLDKDPDLYVLSSIDNKSD